MQPDFLHIAVGDDLQCIYFVLRVVLLADSVLLEVFSNDLHIVISSIVV